MSKINWEKFLAYYLGRQVLMSETQAAIKIVKMMRRDGYKVKARHKGER